MKKQHLRKINNSIIAKAKILSIFLLVIFQLSLVSLPAAQASEIPNKTMTPILNLPFPFSQAIINPTKPILYLIDNDLHQRVYAVNYQTKQISSLDFDGTPVKMAVQNGELFIALQKSKTGDPLNDIAATGSIVIVNTSTFTITDQIPLDFVPNDMVVNNDFIYIVPYGKYQNLLTYSRKTKKKIAVGPDIAANSHLLFNPKLNRLYSYVEGKTVTVYSYDVYDKDVKSNNFSQFFFSETSLNNDLFLSADGEYIFTTDCVVMDADLNHVTSLPYSFLDIAFNSNTNDFYTVDRDKSRLVKAYNYDYDNPYGFRTFKQNTTFTAHGYIRHVFYQNGKLITLTTGGDNGSMAVETANVSTSLQPYQPNPLDPVIPVNFKPTDSLMDPNKPVIYLTDNTNRRIYAVNYKTKSISFIQLEMPPEKMAFANNELYVTLMQRDNKNSLNQDSTGKLAIIDTDDFSLTKKIPLNMVPDDIAADGGYIYIVSYTNQGINITSFARSTGQIIDTKTFTNDAYQSDVDYADLHIYYPGERILDSQGFAQLMITNDKLYLVEEDLFDRRDIRNVYVYNLTNGVLGASHDLMSNNEHNSAITLLTDDFRLSPDGHNLFNGVGNVFDQDLKYITRLDSPFTDAAFDPQYNRFYTANTRTADNPFPRTISVYDNNLNSTGTFTKVDTLSFLSREVTYMAYQDRNIITVSKNDFADYFDNQYFIQVIPVAETLQLPVTPTVNPVVRFGGIDQYQTAAKIAEAGWKENSDAIVLSAGMQRNLIDAMSAGPLASLLNAPIILTDGNNQLNQFAKAQITRLKPSKAYITSGTAVIKPTVLEELESMGITPVELGGYDQYETSVNIAKEMQVLGAEITKVVVVSGGVKPADALSIGSIAASQQMPVLATTKNQLPTKVKEYLEGIHDSITDSYVVGGTAVVSDIVKNSLPGHKERYAGNTKYDTNLEVLKNRANNLNYNNVYVANGETLVDALAGVPLAAKTSSPIMLADKTLSSSMLEYAKMNLSNNVIALGGEAVIAKDSVNQLSSNDLLNVSNSTLGGKDSNNPGEIKNTLVITGDNLTLQNATEDYSLYIQGENDSLKNVTIKGTLFINPKNNGSVSLQNVTASKIVILSGSANSIQLQDVKAETLRVLDNLDVIIAPTGDSSFSSVLIPSNKLIEMTTSAS